MPLTVMGSLVTSRLYSINIKSKTTPDLLAIEFRTYKTCRVKLRTKSLAPGHKHS